MSTSRQRILQALRASQKGISQAGIQTDSPDARTKVPAAAHTPRETLCEQLCEQLILNRIRVAHCTTADFASDLGAMLSAASVRHLLIGAHSVWRDVCAEAIATRAGELIEYSAEYEIMRDALFDQVEAGLTSVHACIADTGTLVVQPTAAEPRMLSLAPPIHIAVVTPTTPVFANFDALLASQMWPDPAAHSNTLLISSPSKTADIQQTLAYGAHGPREVCVFMLDQDASRI